MFVLWSSQRVSSHSCRDISNYKSSKPIAILGEFSNVSRSLNSSLFTDSYVILEYFTNRAQLGPYYKLKLV